eukprot:COSAG02_NODE_405_length_23022_cov_14.617764_5_plen_217_part_00
MYLNIRFILVKLTVNFSQYESFTVSTAEFALSEQRRRCRARRRVACTSWREVSAASRQAETPSDGLTAPGSSSRNAWMGSSPAMAAEKRSRCPCVAKGRKRTWRRGYRARCGGRRGRSEHSVDSAKATKMEISPSSKAERILQVPGREEEKKKKKCNRSSQMRAYVRCDFFWSVRLGQTDRGRRSPPLHPTRRCYTVAAGGLGGPLVYTVHCTGNQ